MRVSDITTAIDQGVAQLKGVFDQIDNSAPEGTSEEEIMKVKTEIVSEMITSLLDQQVLPSLSKISPVFTEIMDQVQPKIDEIFALITPIISGTTGAVAPIPAEVLKTIYGLMLDIRDDMEPTLNRHSKIRADALKRDYDNLCGTGLPEEFVQMYLLCKAGSGISVQKAMKTAQGGAQTASATSRTNASRTTGC